MNRFGIWLAAVMAAIISMFPMAGLAEGVAECDALNTISVNGHASIFVEPDMASISFGVTQTRPDAALAQAAANESINAATEALKLLGIEDSFIRTDSIRVVTKYDYDDAEKEPVFMASTSLNVTVHDIALAGSVIDAGINAGLNTVNDVVLMSSKQDEYYHQALSDACKAARAKAEVLASAAGVDILFVHSISESGYGNIYASSYMSMDGGAPADDAGGSTTGISAGQLEISADVSAVFATN